MVKNVTTTTTVDIDQPINLETTMESGQVFRWEEVQGWYIGVIGRDGYAIKQTSSGLLIRTSNPDKQATIKSIRNFFRLDDDLEKFYAELQHDQSLREAFQHWRGLRLIKQDPWECLISFVCSSVSNIPRIKKNLNSLAKAYGRPIYLANNTVYEFPSPRQLSKISVDDLLQLGLGFRAEYIVKIVNHKLAGKLNLQKLLIDNYANAKAELTKLPGVGNKIADCVLLFSLEKLEGFPIDRWVMRALVDWYGHSENARYSDLLNWAHEMWGTKAGYVQQYMYQQRRLS